MAGPLVEPSPSARRRRRSAGALLLGVALLSGCGASAGTALTQVDRTSVTVAEPATSSTTTLATTTTLDPDRGDLLVESNAVPGGVNETEARCMLAALDAEHGPAATDDLVEMVAAIDDPLDWLDADPADLAARDHLLGVAGTCMSETRVVNRLALSAVQGGFTSAEGRCYGTKRVAAKGKADALRIEFTLPRDAALVNDVYETLLACGDARTPFAKGLVAQGLTQEQADCVANRVRSDDLRALIVAGLTDGDVDGTLVDVLPRLEAAFTACGARRGGTA